MKLIVKIVLGLVAVVVLVLAGAGVILATLNPNDYKERIVAVVKDKTGRDLVLGGDIKLLYFPVLGFEAAKVSLGNPAGFAEKDFVSVEQAQAGVKILPLLSKKIELSSIKLVDPAITIIKQSNGQTNLEFKQASATEKQATEEKAKAQKMDVSIEDFKIENAKVTYIDKATGKKTVINPLNLNLPGFSLGRMANLAMDMVVSSGPNDRTSLKLTGKVKADMDKGIYDLRNLKADITTRNAAMPQDMAVILSGDVVADTKAEKISITDLKANAKGTDVSGQATIQGFKKPDVNFALKAPSIDVNAFAPPKKKGAGAAGNKAAANDNKPLLPVDLIKGLSVKGEVDIGTLKAAGLTMSDVHLVASGKNGVINLDPFTLKLYDGTFVGKTRIDASSGTPVFATSGTLKDLQVSGLIKDKMGADYLSGKAKSEFDLTSRGNKMNDLKSNAGGNFNFNFSDGYINKWQLSGLINQAIDYFETGKLNQITSDKIHFTGISGSFSGNNGTFTNNDLILRAPKSHGLGSGTVSLRNQSVDYTLRVGKGEDPEKVKDKRKIPVRISGPLNAPRYSIDVQAMAMDAAQEKIQEKKQELLNKAFEKLGGKKEAAAPAPAVTPDAATTAQPVEAAPAAVSEKRSSEEEAKELLRGLLGGQ